MSGLLTAGVPLTLVMAFWLSSPITDPAMLATTAATLGLAFVGGAVTGLFSNAYWAKNALRENGLARRLSAARCGRDQHFDPLIWR